MAIGCSKPPASDETSDNNAAPKTSSWFGKKEVTVPAGTVITVRLANAVGSKLSNSGDQFSASVATPAQSWLNTFPSSYIVVVVDVPAGCTLIEYPSAAWGFTSPRTGAIGRWFLGHGAK